MLTGKRIWTLALIFGLCVLATAGCRRKGSRTTIVNGSDIFTTDNFPGSSVQNGNVADDQRAMSVSGSDISTGPSVFFNGQRGTAIVTYTVAAPGGQLLYAHYYDGGSWTPPVALAALDTNLLSVNATTAVAFLNTNDFGDNYAEDRDGDAIILWTANDGASAVAGDGVNRNLYATYFDVSESGNIASNYGFQQFAQRLSTEDDNVGGTGEDVSTFGFVSDGLCGEARWWDGGNDYEWGDDTSEIIAFWRQDSDNDAVGGFQSDQYWAFSRFDLDQAVDADLPLPAGAATRGSILGFGASDSGVTSEETQVYTEFTSYNNVLFYKVASSANAGSLAGYTPAAMPGYGSLSALVDVTVQEEAFQLNAGTLSTPGTLHAVAPSSTTIDTFQCNASWAVDKGGFSGYGHRRKAMYGSDEGLATLTVFSFQLVTDPNAVFGEVTADGRLRLTELDEATGGIIGASDVDGEDIDTSDTVTVFDSRISRNGDYIWVAWQENVDVAPTGPSGDDHTGLWAAQYITTRIDGDGLFPTPPALTSSLSAPINLNSVITGGFSIRGFQFQTYLGYVCGIQSDPDVMHVFYEHSDGTGDTVFDARLTADLDPAGNCVPTTAVAAWEGYTLEGDQGDWSGFAPREEHYYWKAVDSGEGGNAITFYRQDIDATATTDPRVQSEKNGVGGGKVEVDSATTDRVTNVSLIHLAAAPPGSDIGAFDLATGDDDSERTHGVSTVDVFFTESQVNETDGLPVYYRTRRYYSNDTSVTFGDQFAPNAGTAFEEPFYFGNPELFTTNQLQRVTYGNFFHPDGLMPVSGDVVGIYFTQGNRVYYQEASSGDSGLPWQTTDGVSNPFLVDDDNDEEYQNFRGLFIPSCGCSGLEGSMVFWSKAYGSGSGGGFSERLQVRVRDGDNN